MLSGEIPKILKFASALVSCSYIFIIYCAGQDPQYITNQSTTIHVPVVRTAVAVELPAQWIRNHPKHLPLRERIVHLRKQLAQK